MSKHENATCYFRSAFSSFFLSFYVTLVESEMLRDFFCLGTRMNKKILPLAASLFFFFGLQAMEDGKQREHNLLESLKLSETKKKRYTLLEAKKGEQVLKAYESAKKFR